jgi:hypothetical protein
MLQTQTPEKPVLPPIQEMILKGVQQTLADTFALSPERIVFFASTDRLKIAQKVAQLHAGFAGGIKWPIMLLHMNGLSRGDSEQMHGYNSKSMARHGQYLKMSESKTRVLKTNLVPVVTEIEVFYMTDSFEDAFKYSCAWMTNGINNRMNFTATYAGLGIDIRCEMSPQINTPDLEASIDQPNVYEYISTIKVAGYASDAHPNGTSYIQVLSKPVINVSMADQTEDDPQVWSHKHQMPIVKENT